MKKFIVRIIVLGPLNPYANPKEAGGEQLAKMFSGKGEKGSDLITVILLSLYPKNMPPLTIQSYLLSR